MSFFLQAFALAVLFETEVWLKLGSSLVFLDGSLV